MKGRKRHACATLAATAMALSAPPALADSPPPDPTIGWQPGMPPPPGYRVEREIRLPFVISGASLHFSTWAPMLVLGGVLVSDRDNSPDERSAYTQLMVPLVGPLLVMTRYSGMFPGAWKAMLVADQLGQIAGLTLMTIGLAWQKPVLKRAPVRDRWRPDFGMPVPFVFPSGGVGLGFVGTM